jgi:hypothetical protein
MLRHPPAGNAEHCPYLSLTHYDPLRKRLWVQNEEVYNRALGVSMNAASRLAFEGNESL